MRLLLFTGLFLGLAIKSFPLALIHHQGIICGVAFVRSSLRRMTKYASFAAPREGSCPCFGALHLMPSW